MENYSYMYIIYNLITLCVCGYQTRKVQYKYTVVMVVNINIMVAEESQGIAKVIEMHPYENLM